MSLPSRRGGTPMHCNRRRGSGFSLAELLVVIGIITLLIAVLLPVLARVRMASRSVVCLSNLRQWGQAFQMYLSNNHGRTIPEQGSELTSVRWWEALAPYNGDVRTLLCPEAAEPRDNSPVHDGVRPL